MYTSTININLTIMEFSTVSAQIDYTKLCCYEMYSDNNM